MTAWDSLVPAPAPTAATLCAQTVQRKDTTLMSHDLYLWHATGTQPVTADQAKTICDQLACDQDDAITPNAAVLAFHEDVLSRFPRLETLPNPEDSPWNMNPDATASRAILCMAYSTAAATIPVILDLAARHALICYDATTGTVHNPPQTDRPTDLRLQSCDGTVTVNPSQDSLRSQLDRLSTANWYIFLEREEGWFVQVGIGQYAGNVPAGKFALEYREGDPDRHYRVEVDNFNDVARLFTSFAARQESFKTAFAWTQY